jgi:hypothetical protein
MVGDKIGLNIMAMLRAVALLATIGCGGALRATGGAGRRGASQRQAMRASGASAADGAAGGAAPVPKRPWALKARSAALSALSHAIPLVVVASSLAPPAQASILKSYDAAPIASKLASVPCFMVTNSRGRRAAMAPSSDRATAGVSVRARWARAGPLPGRFLRDRYSALAPQPVPQGLQRRDAAGSRVPRGKRRRRTTPWP